MSATLPTVAEYARMSWAARQRTASRLRELERGQQSAAIEQARAILDTIPAEPESVTAARRAAIA